jgi:hypothetical protein
MRINRNETFKPITVETIIYFLSCALIILIVDKIITIFQIRNYKKLIRVFRENSITKDIHIQALHDKIKYYIQQLAIEKIRTEITENK